MEFLAAWERLVNNGRVSNMSSASRRRRVSQSNIVASADRQIINFSTAHDSSNTRLTALRFLLLFDHFVLRTIHFSVRLTRSRARPQLVLPLLLRTRVYSSPDVVGVCWHASASSASFSAKMKLPSMPSMGSMPSMDLSKNILTRSKTGFHAAQALLIFIAWALTLAVLIQAGNTDGRTKWFFTMVCISAWSGCPFMSVRLTAGDTVLAEYSSTNLPDSGTGMATRTEVWEPLCLRCPRCALHGTNALTFKSKAASS